MQSSGSASEARGPSPADQELVRRVAAADHNWAVIATGRRNGTVQATIVTAGVINHPRGGQPTVAFVTRGGSVKLRNLRRRNLSIGLRHPARPITEAPPVCRWSASAD